MRDKIIEHLKELETQRNIKILWACETGSRAWGFPSPDSDFDVRILYVHKMDWYLSVNDSRDTIDTFYEDNEIDISGWELKKSLRLLRKSNAALLERIQSPIIYMQDEAFRQDYIKEAQKQYSKIATMHHYMYMAKGILEEMETDKEYKLKKLFYALRCAAVCQWILQKEEMPPIEFTKIYPVINLPQTLVLQINELIKLKATKSESYWHKGENDIVNFVKESIEEAESKAKSLAKGSGKLESLNSLLQKYIRKYDDSRA